MGAPALRPLAYGTIPKLSALAIVADVERWPVRTVVRELHESMVKLQKAGNYEALRSVLKSCGFCWRGAPVLRVVEGGRP